MKIKSGKLVGRYLCVALVGASGILPVAVRDAHASCEMEPGQLAATSGCEAPGTLGGIGAPDTGAIGGGSGGVPEVYVYLSIDGNIYYTSDKLTAGSYALANGLAQGTRFALYASGQTTTYWIYKGLGVAVPFGG